MRHEWLEIILRIYAHYENEAIRVTLDFKISRIRNGTRQSTLDEALSISNKILSRSSTSKPDNHFALDQQILQV